MKECSACREKKDFSEFSIKSKAKGTYIAWCKKCVSAYDKERWSNPGLVEKKRLQKLKRVTGNKIFIYNYFSTHPCVDCGETDPVVLEFDHQRDKLGDISTMVGTGVSIGKIEAEIAKCEVVCANCHRRRTSKSLGWYTYIDNELI